MTWLAVVACVVALVALGALIYWHLIIAEGAYMGPRAVAWTYDWVARRYDGIKQFDPGDEDWFVGGPLLRGLAGAAAVLRACCERTGFEPPPLPFLCTVRLARAQWDIHPTKLPDVCRHLGIELRHHQADSDAEACARIVIAAEQAGWVY